MGTAIIYYGAASVAIIAAALFILVVFVPDQLLHFYMRFLLLKAGARIKYVNSSNYTFCYAVRGSRSTKPSLVLVHGFSANKDSWTVILQRLPKDLHVIIVDLPGHGDSTIPGEDEEVTLHTLTESLRQIITGVGLKDKPFHLVGTSMGGTIVSLYAAYYPEDVNRLTVVCPAMRTPVVTQFQKDIQEKNKSHLLPETPEEVGNMLNILMHHKQNIHRQVLVAILKLRKPKMPFWTRLLENIHLLVNGPVGDELECKLQDIMAPTQIIWGKEDELLHYSGAEHMKKMLPNCKRVDLIDDCGHTIVIDRPGMFTKFLLEFHQQEF